MLSNITFGLDCCNDVECNGCGGCYYCDEYAVDNGYPYCFFAGDTFFCLEGVSLSKINELPRQNTVTDEPRSVAIPIGDSGSPTEPRSVASVTGDASGCCQFEDNICGMVEASDCIIYDEDSKDLKVYGIPKLTYETDGKYKFDINVKYNYNFFPITRFIGVGTNTPINDIDNGLIDLTVDNVLFEAEENVHLYVLSTDDEYFIFITDKDTSEINDAINADPDVIKKTLITNFFLENGRPNDYDFNPNNNYEPTPKSVDSNLLCVDNTCQISQCYDYDGSYGAVGDGWTDGPEYVESCLEDRCPTLKCDPPDPEHDSNKCFYGCPISFTAEKYPSFSDDQDGLEDPTNFELEIWKQAYNLPGEKLTGLKSHIGDYSTECDDETLEISTTAHTKTCHISCYERFGTSFLSPYCAPDGSYFILTYDSYYWGSGNIPLIYEGLCEESPFTNAFTWQWGNTVAMFCLLNEISILDADNTTTASYLDPMHKCQGWLKNSYEKDESETGTTQESNYNIANWHLADEAYHSTIPVYLSKETTANLYDGGTESNRCCGDDHVNIQGSKIDEGYISNDPNYICLNDYGEDFVDFGKSDNNNGKGFAWFRSGHPDYIGQIFNVSYNKAGFDYTVISNDTNWIACGIGNVAEGTEFITYWGGHLPDNGWSENVEGGAYMDGNFILLHLEEESAEEYIRDSSGIDNRGIAYAGLSYKQPGKYDYGIGFNGVNSYIELRNYEQVANSFTFGGWFKPTGTITCNVGQTSSGTEGTSGQRYAVYPEQRGSDAGVGLSVGTNGVRVIEHGNSYMPPVASTCLNLNDGQYHHIMVVYNFGLPSIYVDGVKTTTGVKSGKTVYSPRKLGGEPGGWGWYKGTIDEFAVWHKVFSAEMISDLANRPTEPEEIVTSVKNINFDSDKGVVANHGDVIEVINNDLYHDYLCTSNDTVEYKGIQEGLKIVDDTKKKDGLFFECAATDEFSEETNPAFDTVAGDAYHNALGDVMVVGQTVFYCTNKISDIGFDVEYRWLTDLDDLTSIDGKKNCEATGSTLIGRNYNWTGTLCCGDDLFEINKGVEFYNDELGGCWSNSMVLNNNTLATSGNLIANNDFDEILGWNLNDKAGYVKYIQWTLNPYQVPGQRSDTNLVGLNDDGWLETMDLIAVKPLTYNLSFYYTKLSSDTTDKLVVTITEYDKDDLDNHAKITNFPSSGGISTEVKNFIHYNITFTPSYDFIKIKFSYTGAVRSFIDKVSLYSTNDILVYNGQFYGCGYSNELFDDYLDDGVSPDGDEFISLNDLYYTSDIVNFWNNLDPLLKIQDTHYEYDLPEADNPGLIKGADYCQVFQFANNDGVVCEKIGIGGEWVHDDVLQESTDYSQNEAGDYEIGLPTFDTNEVVPVYLRNYTSDRPTEINSGNSFGCCPQNYCWNGTVCVGDMTDEHGTYMVMGTGNDYDNPNNDKNVLRCIKGEWEWQPIKYTWDLKEKGFCALDNQCLVNPEHTYDLENYITTYNPYNDSAPKENWIGGQGTIDIGCINDSYFIGDHYCENGDWTTRTKFIASEMLDYAQDKDEDYSLHCGGIEVLNLIDYTDKDEYWMGGATYPLEKANSYCILEMGEDVLVGTSFNEKMINDGFREDEVSKETFDVAYEINTELFNESGGIFSEHIEGCDSALIDYDDYGEYARCDEKGGSDLFAYYNNKTWSMIFGSVDDFNRTNDIIDFVTYLYQELIIETLSKYVNDLPPTVNPNNFDINEEFSKLFITKKGDYVAKAVTFRSTQIGRDADAVFVINITNPPYDINKFVLEMDNSVDGDRKTHGEKWHSILDVTIDGVLSDKFDLNDPDVDLQKLWKRLTSMLRLDGYQPERTND
ncbi:LamG domain-containing protein [Nanoarchaeota archaeon]